MGLAVFGYYDTAHRLPAYLPRAAALLRRGLAGGQDRTDARIALGRALAEMDSLQAAVSVLADAAARDTTSGMAALWLGATRLDAGDAAGAARDLRRAVRQMPRYTEARIKLAEALASRPADAAAVLDAALRADPVRHASAWNDLGFYRLQAGDVPAATRRPAPRRRARPAPAAGARQPRDGAARGGRPRRGRRAVRGRAPPRARHRARARQPRRRAPAAGPHGRRAPPLRARPLPRTGQPAGRGRPRQPPPMTAVACLSSSRSSSPPAGSRRMRLRPGRRPDGPRASRCGSTARARAASPSPSWAATPAAAARRARPGHGRRATTSRCTRSSSRPRSARTSRMPTATARSGGTSCRPFSPRPTPRATACPPTLAALRADAGFPEADSALFTVEVEGSVMTHARRRIHVPLAALRSALASFAAGDGLHYPRRHAHPRRARRRATASWRRPSSAAGRTASGTSPSTTPRASAPTPRRRRRARSARRRSARAATSGSASSSPSARSPPRPSTGPTARGATPSRTPSAAPRRRPHSRSTPAARTASWASTRRSTRAASSPPARPARPRPPTSRCSTRLGL